MQAPGTSPTPRRRRRTAIAASAGPARHPPAPGSARPSPPGSPAPPCQRIPAAARGTSPVTGGSGA
ncbi:hypothetical protein ACFFX0_14580 [Citricoccus parietis]|uniref:Uncharacterized protein n=1 Tax=Citricoccus parietis TaxID=592307 RepID=A0ABV5G093_9MICC